MLLALPVAVTFTSELYISCFIYHFKAFLFPLPSTNDKDRNRSYDHYKGNRSDESPSSVGLFTQPASVDRIRKNKY